MSSRQSSSRAGRRRRRLVVAQQQQQEESFAPSRAQNNNDNDDDSSTATEDNDLLSEREDEEMPKNDESQLLLDDLPKIHSLVQVHPVADAEDAEDGDENDDDDDIVLHLGRGENWLRFVSQRHDNDDADADDDAEELLFPSVLQFQNMGKIDAPSDNVFLSVDVSSDNLLVVKDWRLPKDDDDDDNEDESPVTRTSIQVWIARKAKKHWMLPKELLTRRQPEVLAPGDWLCVGACKNNNRHEISLVWKYTVETSIEMSGGDSQLYDCSQTQTSTQAAMMTQDTVINMYRSRPRDKDKNNDNIATNAACQSQDLTGMTQEEELDGEASLLLQRNSVNGEYLTQPPCSPPTTTTTSARPVSELEKTAKKDNCRSNAAKTMMTTTIMEMPSTTVNDTIHDTSSMRPRETSWLTQPPPCSPAAPPPQQDVEQTMMVEAAPAVNGEDALSERARKTSWLTQPPLHSPPPPPPPQQQQQDVEQTMMVEEATTVNGEDALSARPRETSWLTQPPPCSPQQLDVERPVEEATTVNGDDASSARPRETSWLTLPPPRSPPPPPQQQDVEQPVEAATTVNGDDASSARPRETSWLTQQPSQPREAGAAEDASAFEKSTAKNDGTKKISIQSASMSEEPPSLPPSAPTEGPGNDTAYGDEKNQHSLKRPHSPATMEFDNNILLSVKQDGGKAAKRPRSGAPNETIEQLKLEEADVHTTVRESTESGAAEQTKQASADDSDDETVDPSIVESENQEIGGVSENPPPPSFVADSRASKRPQSPTIDSDGLHSPTQESAENGSQHKHDSQLSKRRRTSETTPNTKELDDISELKAFGGCANKDNVGNSESQTLTTTASKNQMRQENEVLERPHTRDIASDSARTCTSEVVVPPSVIAKKSSKVDDEKLATDCTENAINSDEAKNVPEQKAVAASQQGDVIAEQVENEAKGADELDQAVAASGVAEGLDDSDDDTAEPETSTAARRPENETVRDRNETPAGIESASLHAETQLVTSDPPTTPSTNPVHSTNATPSSCKTIASERSESLLSPTDLRTDYQIQEEENQSEQPPHTTPHLDKSHNRARASQGTDKVDHPATACAEPIANQKPLAVTLTAKNGPLKGSSWILQGNDKLCIGSKPSKPGFKPLVITGEPSVDENHASVEFASESDFTFPEYKYQRLKVLDLGSKEGTFINNCAVSTSTARALFVGDVLNVGEVTFEVSGASDSHSSAVANEQNDSFSTDDKENPDPVSNAAVGEVTDSASMPIPTKDTQASPPALAIPPCTHRGGSQEVEKLDHPATACAEPIANQKPLAATLTAKNGPLKGSSWILQGNDKLCIGSKPSKPGFKPLVITGEPSVDENHASVEFASESDFTFPEYKYQRLKVLDLGSKEGTFINNCAVSTSTARALFVGDVLNVGEVTFEVSGASDSHSSADSTRSTATQEKPDKVVKQPAKRSVRKKTRPKESVVTAQIRRSTRAQMHEAAPEVMPETPSGTASTRELPPDKADGLSTKRSSRKKKAPQKPIKTPTSTRRTPRGQTHDTRADALPIAGNISILVSGLTVDKEIKDCAEKIGAKVIDDVTDAHLATHVIQHKKVKFTPKVLIAMCKTPNVVSLDWLRKCGAQGQVVPCDDFFLLQKKVIENINLNLSRGHGILDGWAVFVWKGVAGNKCPPQNELKLIVEAAGGIWLDKLPKKPDAKILCITGDRPSRAQRAAGCSKTMKWFLEMVKSQEMMLE